jgi:hypothetical protein
MVVARPVVIDPGAVVLPPRVPELARGAGPARRRLPERRVAVLLIQAIARRVSNEKTFRIHQGRPRYSDAMGRLVMATLSSNLYIPGRF